MSTIKKPYNILPLSATQYIISLSIFLFLLGSHLFDYYPWVFVIMAVIIVDWRQAKKWESALVIALIFSMYVTWYFIDPNILHHTLFLGQGALVFMVYLLALSSVQAILKSKTLSIEKILFYLIFIFFIGYMFSLVYSYLFLEADNPVTREGMYVCFQNEYKRIHMNGGNLISTIIAYYLSFMVIALPLILFHFKSFKKQGFYSMELISLITLSLFALFLALQMQRRTVILLLLMSSSYFTLYKLWQYAKGMDIKKIWGVIIFFVCLAGLSYYFLQDTAIMKRLITEGLHDRRFGWWVQGIQAMLDYPFGGGYDVIVGQTTKLAHNTWIDIGKDFGIIPFIVFILLSFTFLYRLSHLLLFKNISLLTKHMIVIVTASLFIIFMIEPIFNSDKTFFIYYIYLFGLLVALDHAALSEK